jgi:hypothetical protein
MRWVSITGAVLASRQTAVTVSFSVTQDADDLVFAFGPPLNDSLTGSVLQKVSDGTSGTWTCPATLPFADDSVLLSKGYEAAPAPGGTWSLRWVSPVD